MGINNFLYSLLTISIIFLFIDKKEIIAKVEVQEQPIVSFYDSVMYDITTKNIDQMVQSSEAYIYKNREELTDGLIVTRVIKNKPTDTGVNIIKADYLIKIKDDLYLDGDVHLQLSNSIDLKTEQLEYNMKTLVAKNSIDFDITQDKSHFKGNTLYLDAKNNHLIAKNAKIKIKVLKNEKK
jgi:hypothetical protein